MADPIERPLITVNPVLVAAHFNQVVLTVWETGGVLACEAALSIGIKNAVRFQCSNHSAAFSIMFVIRLPSFVVLLLRFIPHLTTFEGAFVCEFAHLENVNIFRILVRYSLNPACILVVLAAVVNL